MLFDPHTHPSIYTVIVSLTTMPCDSSSSAWAEGARTRGSASWVFCLVPMPVCLSVRYSWTTQLCCSTPATIGSIAWRDDDVRIVLVSTMTLSSSPKALSRTGLWTGKKTTMASYNQSLHQSLCSHPKNWNPTDRIAHYSIIRRACAGL